MSSVPVQFLIYVLAEPSCPDPPTIIPLSDCLEVTVGVQKSFELYVMNPCDSNVSKIVDIIVSNPIDGMDNGNLTDSPTNDSLSYIPYTWTPRTDQIGQHQICATAYTK